MIKLINTQIEGFGSIIKKITFSLDQEGLNIMRGRMGSGKTSIPNALYWCFFGESLKKKSTIQTYPELQPEGFKGTMVANYFEKGEDDYAIIRCLNYDKVIFDKKKGKTGIYILKNKEDITPKGKVQTQVMINKIIDYTPELFINSIVFGQKLKRIIEQSGPDKKKLFDEAFETIFVDNARKKATKEQVDLKGLIEIKETEKEGLKDKLETLKKTMKELISFERNFKDIKKGKVKGITKEIAKAKTKIEKIQEKLGALDIIDIFEINQQLEEKTEILNNLRDKINKAKSKQDEKATIVDNLTKAEGKLRAVAEDGKCFECGSDLGKKAEKQLKDKWQKKITQLAAELQEINQKLNKIKMPHLEADKKLRLQEVEELKEKLSDLKSNKALKEELEEQKDLYEDLFRRLRTDRKKAKKEKLEIKSGTYQADIDKALKDMNKLDLRLKRLNKEKAIYDWMIKDPLSNSGIKAYIFNSLLNKVNQCLSSYAGILGFNIEFGIDLESANKDFYQVIYREDMIVPYEDLSGGQKQLVDTSVALAIHDVISSVRPINILFLDEPFEGLGVEDIDMMADLIAHKAIDRSLFIITHHNSFNPTGSNTIYFNLEHGQTLIS